MNLPENRTLDLLINEIHVLGGLAVVAHPSRNNHFIPKKILYEIDGMEIWNAVYDSRYLPDPKAISLYNDIRILNSDIVAIGGLDLHDGTGFRDLRISVSDRYYNQSELIDLIKKGCFENRGRYVNVPSMPNTGFVKSAVLRMGRGLLTIADKVRLGLNPLRNKFHMKML